MLIKLLRDARIRHHAGELVEASPAEAAFLISINSAVEVLPAPETVETPEDSIVKAETPEAKRPRRKKEK